MSNLRSFKLPRFLLLFYIYYIILSFSFTLLYCLSSRYLFQNGFTVSRLCTVYSWSNSFNCISLNCLSFESNVEIFYLPYSNSQYSKTLGYTLVFWYDIVNNRNVPTYLKPIMVYIPIMLNFDVFHIVKSLI